jgi:ribosomal protein L37AE/L43A
MRRNREVGDKKNKNEECEVRMELKYCERCGGLWVRECGAGVVYCNGCQKKVADLPIPKKKPQRLTLPVRRQPLLNDYTVENGNDDSLDFEAAAGGVA